MLEQPIPISILLYILIGMVFSLLTLSWMIVQEVSGYKGPSKVLSEQYKRSAQQHPEMREANDSQELLIFDANKFRINKN